MKKSSARRAHLATPLLLLGLALSSTGCATVTGFASGGFTGSVDLPNVMYQMHRERIDRNPVYWGPLVVVFSPLGALLGPLMGAVKGVAIDVQSGVQGRYRYASAWAGYDHHSVWRPYTFKPTGRGL